MKNPITIKGMRVEHFYRIYYWNTSQKCWRQWWQDELKAEIKRDDGTEGDNQRLALAMLDETRCKNPDMKFRLAAAVEVTEIVTEVFA